MSDNDSQLFAEYNNTININAKDITAMLVIDNDTKIVTADKKMSKLQLFAAENFELLNELTLKRVGWLGIADMTLVDSETFAVLIPGVWIDSDICIYKIDKDNNIRKTGKFNIGIRSYGFCYQRDFFFVTFSPSTFFGKTGPGHVEMINKIGKREQIFTVDKDNDTLFGNPLSRIHVDKNFRMFVSDMERSELTILKIDSINREVTVLTRHKYVVTDTTTSIDGTSFLATSHRDGVVLLHSNGGWVFNNFLTRIKLEGKPLSVAYQETGQQLLVATQRSRWYSPWKKWLVIIVYDVKESHYTDTRVTIEN